MATFDELFGAFARPALLRGLGASATYTPDGGEPVTVTGILGEQTTERREDDAGNVERVDVRQFTVGTDPDDAQFGGVAEPSDLATVTVDGCTYAIEHVQQSAHLAVLHLVKIGRAEMGRPELRRKLP